LAYLGEPAGLRQIPEPKEKLMRSVKTIGSDHKAENGEAVEKRPNPPEPIEDFIRQNAFQTFPNESQQVGTRNVTTAKPTGGKRNPTSKTTNKPHKVAGPRQAQNGAKKLKKRAPRKHYVAKTAI